MGDFISAYLLKLEDNIKRFQNLTYFQFCLYKCSQLVGFRHSTLTEIRSRHIMERDRCQDDLVACHNDIRASIMNSPDADRRYRFYQEMRGYVTDLVECIDNKVRVPSREKLGLSISVMTCLLVHCVCFKKLFGRAADFDYT